MSLYGDYVKERLGDEIVEDSIGFASYRFLDEKTCYLIDLYVSPESRMRGVASDKADIIVEIAKSKGCTKLVMSIVPSAKGSTQSLKAALAYGMILDSCSNDFILLKKEI